MLTSGLSGSVSPRVFRRPIRSLAPVVAVLVAAGLVATPAVAATATGTSFWGMNEPAPAAVMTDGKQGIDGTIGNEVQVSVRDGDVTGYRWPWIAKRNAEYRPERLVIVPEDDRLDPDASRFTVAIEVNTRPGAKNIIQKGQAQTAGGFWKIETAGHEIKCVFRGAAETLSVLSGPINDGTWHTVACDLRQDRLIMRVDGSQVDVRLGSTGPINNSMPMSVGGKMNCANENVGCDYFTGMLGSVRIAKK